MHPLAGNFDSNLDRTPTHERLFGEVERVALSRIQKIAGPRLHASWVNLPHVTQNDDADITELEAFRKEQKGAAKEQGISLTPLAFIMKAVVMSLKEFPTINSSQRAAASRRYERCSL